MIRNNFFTKLILMFRLKIDEFIEKSEKKKMFDLETERVKNHIKEMEM